MINGNAKYTTETKAISGGLINMPVTTIDACMIVKITAAGLALPLTIRNIHNDDEIHDVPANVNEYAIPILFTIRKKIKIINKKKKPDVKNRIRAKFFVKESVSLYLLNRLSFNTAEMCILFFSGNFQ